MNEKEIELFLASRVTSKLDETAKNEIRQSFSRITDPEIDFENHKEFATSPVNGEFNEEYKQALKPILARFQERESERRNARQKLESKKRLKYNLFLFLVVLPIMLVVIELSKRHW